MIAMQLYAKAVTRPENGGLREQEHWFVRRRECSACPTETRSEEQLLTLND